MRKYFILFVILFCSSFISAQNRTVNIDKSNIILSQIWTLNTIRLNLFTTTCRWSVECTNQDEKIQIPLDTYIEDCDSKKRYLLSMQPELLISKSHGDKVVYESVFQGLPPTVKRINIISSAFSISNIGLSDENEYSIDTHKTQVPHFIHSSNNVEDEKVTFCSDVDINIPKVEKINSNTFALIIANENYLEVENVPYAIHDGEIFSQYCTRTLGIPLSNIKYLSDATLNNIRRQVIWLEQIMDAYNGEATVIFYYAGHGIPDESNRSAYLLPIDGFGYDVSTGYSLDKLYADLGSKPAKTIIVMLDACFSGAQRDGSMLTSARSVAIKSKQNKPKGNMFVISATQGDETAYPYNEQRHGLFTYFLLKKLQETKGDVMCGELAEYIINMVKKESVITNGKMQTPNVSVSSSMNHRWKKIKLK